MQLLRRIWKLLASPYLAIGLLLLLLLATVGGALFYADAFPQLSTEDKTALIFQSTWFFVLSGLLLLNTFCCTVRQTQRALRRFRGSVAKKRWAVFASPVFHFGLVILISGAFIDHFAGFTGYLAVRPGIPVQDQPGEYLNLVEKPLYRGGHDRFSVLLDKIYFEYQPDEAVASGKISVLQAGIVVRNQLLTEANPISLGQVSIKLDKHGYYVNYQLKESNGQIVDQRALGLNTYFPPQATQYLTENARAGNSPYRLRLEFFPEVSTEGGEYRTASYQMKHPAVLLTANDNTQMVFSGLVKQGQTVQFKDGRSFTFHSVTPYLYLRVQSIFGTYIVVIGFLVLVAGLVAYYVQEG